MASVQRLLEWLPYGVAMYKVVNRLTVSNWGMPGQTVVVFSGIASLHQSMVNTIDRLSMLVGV